MQLSSPWLTTTAVANVFSMLTYAETLDFVYHLEVERMDLKLERVAQALALCGSPHEHFPAIHIAGTNGKGSTAALLHAMLSAAGYRVGLFTSPHLIDFCERIRLGADWISQQAVIEGVAEIRAQTEAADIRLTPFEMMTVLAFWAFARAELDLAIVEVGLGGRLDATNVLTPLVSVITQIGLDHQAYLGPTLAHIAREKGGIIKPRVPVVIGNVEADSRDILCGLASQADSPSLVYGRDFSAQGSGNSSLAYHGRDWQLSELRLSLQGSFQYENAATALATLECLRDIFPVTPEQLRTGLHNAVWPGRFQIVSEQPFVVLDGAHNPQAINALVTELTEIAAIAKNRRIQLLFGVMRDKEWQAMIPPLAQIADEIVVTQVQQQRAEDPHLVAAAFADSCPTQVIVDAPTACRQLLAALHPDQMLVVCGSLFLVAEVMPLFPTAMNQASVCAGTPSPLQRNVG